MCSDYAVSVRSDVENLTSVSGKFFVTLALTPGLWHVQALAFLLLKIQTVLLQVEMCVKKVKKIKK